MLLLGNSNYNCYTDHCTSLSSVWIGQTGANLKTYQQNVSYETYQSTLFNSINHITKLKEYFLIIVLCWLCYNASLWQSQRSIFWIFCGSGKEMNVMLTVSVVFSNRCPSRHHVITAGGREPALWHNKSYRLPADNGWCAPNRRMFNGVTVKIKHKKQLEHEWAIKRINYMRQWRWWRQCRCYLMWIRVYVCVHHSQQFDDISCHTLTFFT